MNETDFNRVFKLPFNEASQFFRDKLNIPTGAWNEIDGAAHAKGFASAGAYNADLLADLRKMTDKAIAGGMDIREFRKQFRPLVERYGWQLQGGGPSWRSDLIWRTNIQTSYQAGRWQQFQDGNIKYLMYIHKDGLMHPRPNHVALDDMIFAVDDPFWTTNYPPNGFGCHCRAVMATEAEYKNADASRKARPDGWEQMADNGWNYNVGQAGGAAGYKALTDKFESLPNDIAGAWMQGFVQESAFARFIDGKIDGEFPVAVLQPADMKLLGTERQTVWLSAESLAKNKGEMPARSGGHPELSLKDYQNIPRVIDEGEVYQVNDERLIYLELGEMVYRAVLKRTQSGKRNYLLSLMKLQRDSKEIDRVRRKNERIR